MQMAPNSMMQPQIILLKEGTDTSQGKAQLISNINACQAVVDVVRTTLGPRGMDKLIHDDNGQVTISNDGATIMRLLQIVHPAANTLVQAFGPRPADPTPLRHANSRVPTSSIVVAPDVGVVRGGVGGGGR